MLFSDCGKGGLSGSEQSEGVELEEGEIRLPHHRLHHQHHHHKHRMRVMADEDDEDEEEDVSADEEEEDEEEDSSLCANSDLSEGDEIQLTTKGCHAHCHCNTSSSSDRIPRHVRQRRVSECSEMSEDGDVLVRPQPERRNVARRGRGRAVGRGAARVPRRSFMSDEGDVEDELCDSGEEAEIAKHMKIVNSKKEEEAIEDEEEDSSLYSSEDLAEEDQEVEEKKIEEKGEGSVKKVQGAPSKSTAIKKGQKPGPLCSKKGAVSKAEQMKIQKQIEMAKREQKELEVMEQIEMEEELIKQREKKEQKDAKKSTEMDTSKEEGANQMETSQVCVYKLV